MRNAFKVAVMTASTFGLLLYGGAPGIGRH